MSCGNPGGACCGGGGCGPTAPAGPSLVKQLGTMGELGALLQSAGDKFVVLDVFTTWCGPCKMMAPKFIQMASQYPDVLFAKIDMDANAQLSTLYKIEGVPTFIFFRHGSQVDIFSGADERRIRTTVERLRTSSYDIIPRNTKVLVQGLVKAAQHNGRTGLIDAYNPVKGRYNVNLQPTSDLPAIQLALKPGSLIQAAGVQLVPSGDAAAGDVAERTGTIVGIVDGSYQVLIDGSGGGESAGGAGVGADGETVAVAPADVILPSGTVIFVAGLQGAPEFNGKQGKILSYDAEAGRYLVQVETMKQLKLKRTNTHAGTMN